MERIILNRHPVLFRFFTMPGTGGLYMPVFYQGGFLHGTWYTASCKRYESLVARMPELTFPESHRAPDKNCECGFYVFTNADVASRELLRSHLTIAYIDSVVLAAVEIDGRVCRHENGLRVERMRILRSWSVKDRRAWVVAAALERVYKQSPLYRQTQPPESPKVWTGSNLSMYYGG